LFSFSSVNATVHTAQQKLKTHKNQIVSNDSSIIVIVEDAKICGKEHLFVKRNKQQTFSKKENKITCKTNKPTANKITEDKHNTIVFPNLPFLPSSSSYLHIGKGFATAVSQQRIGGYQSTGKENRENTFLCIKKSILSLYLPEQRQKFSTSATQCGILTSFSPNSPSISIV